MVLDKRTKKLLDVILRICGDDGAYKIIEIDEIVKGMSPRFKIESEGLAQIFKFMIAMELIDIKYNDENVYCLAVLPKARIYEEHKIEKKKEKAIGKTLVTVMIFGSFFAAMVGSMLAHILLTIID